MLWSSRSTTEPSTGQGAFKDEQSLVVRGQGSSKVTSVLISANAFFG